MVGNQGTERLLVVYERALRLIENINNGPDRASGEWRCEEAAAIAREALKQNDYKHGLKEAST